MDYIDVMYESKDEIKELNKQLKEKIDLIENLPSDVVQFKGNHIFGVRIRTVN